MTSRKDEVRSEYSRRLKELEHLWSNPLGAFPIIGDLGKDISAHPSNSKFLKNHDIDDRLAVTLSDPEKLKSDLEAVCRGYFQQQQQSSEPRKRPAANGPETARKVQKIGSLAKSSRFKVPGSTKTSKNIVPQNLQAQIECLEEETHGFLNKRLADVEVVALPEHLPTQNLNVVSLAELYYLTQTLPLIKLLPGTQKTLMTENFEQAILEGKVAVLFSRIEELKRSKKWSLRQPIRYYDPFVYAKRNKKNRLHTWDYLLQEGKWMAADFRESSKYKKLCCVNMAQAVQDFWNYGKVMCVKRRAIRYLGEGSETNKEEGFLETNVETNPDGHVLGTDGTLLEISPDENVLEVSDENVLETNPDDNVVETSPDQNTLETNPNENISEREESDMDVDSGDLSSVGNATYNTAPDEEVPVEAKETPEFETPEPETIDISKLLERPNPADEILPLNLPNYTPEDMLSAGIDVRNRGPFKAHVNVNDLKKLDQAIVRNLPTFSAFGNSVTASEDDSRNAKAKSIPTGETSVVPVSRMLYPMQADDEWYKIVLRASAEQAKNAKDAKTAFSSKDAKNANEKNSEKNGLPEYQKGLFGVQPHRRLNFLRPPKPPLIKNIDNRAPTIWLPQDDKLLIHYVAEYCFNWDLIAVHLQANATLKRYESNIERRTPWSCFERYIQLNDKFQFSDMKGPNAYPAQQWLETAHKAQSTTKRRISPLGVGNESIQRGHRRLRWASMFDAMRKTMRKRETALAKLGSRKGTASPEGPNAATPGGSGGAGSTSANGSAKRNPDKTPTPSELSSLKLDRDKSMQEAYVHQQATRSKMAAAVGSQKNMSDSQVSTASSGAGPTDANAPKHVLSASTRVPSPARAALQRPQPARPASQPAVQGAGHMGPNKQPPGSFKRPTTPNGTPLTVEQIQRLLQIQKQRRLMQQQAQGAQGTAHSQNSARKTLALAPGAQMAVGNGMAPGNSSSVAPGNSNASKRAPRRMQFPPAQVSAIISSIQQKNPNLSKDQVTKLAASYLANLQQQQQQKYEQQQQQQQQNSADSANQQNLQARQAQLSRSRLAQGQGSGSGSGVSKEAEGPTASKMQYEERKKLMMQQGGSQFAQSGASGSSGGSGSGGSGSGNRKTGSSSKAGKSRAADR